VYRWTARVTPSDAVTLDVLVIGQCDARAAGESAR